MAIGDQYSRKPSSPPIPASTRKRTCSCSWKQGIDAYVADTQFRKRDPRFADRDRYKERFRKEQAAFHGTTTAYTTRYFTMSEDKSHCICPAGKRLHRNGANVIVNHKRVAVKFRGNKTDCLPCALRKQCLRYPDRTETRQVYFFQGRAPSLPESFTEKMKRKIDSVKGRLIYNKRLPTAEPVFANICSTLRLNRFTLQRQTEGEYPVAPLLHGA